MKIICECGHRALAFRFITKQGKYKGRLRIFSDKNHVLCYRCYNAQRNAIRPIPPKEETEIEIIIISDVDNYLDNLETIV